MDYVKHIHVFALFLFIFEYLTKSKKKLFITFQFQSMSDLKQKTQNTPLLSRKSRIRTSSKPSLSDNKPSNDDIKSKEAEQKVKLTNELLTICFIAGHGRAKRTIYPIILGIYMISVIAVQIWLYFYEPCYYLELICTYILNIKKYNIHLIYVAIFFSDFMCWFVI